MFTINIFGIKIEIICLRCDLRTEENKLTVNNSVIIFISTIQILFINIYRTEIIKFKRSKYNFKSQNILIKVYIQINIFCLCFTQRQMVVYKKENVKMTKLHEVNLGFSVFSVLFIEDLLLQHCGSVLTLEDNFKKNIYTLRWLVFSHLKHTKEPFLLHGYRQIIDLKSTNLSTKNSFVIRKID